MPKLNLKVQLVGQDGNIFNLIGIVSKQMKRNGYSDQVNEFIKDITSSKSYNEALRKITTWVNVY